MTMNKYELALVINAKIEDDARTDAIEKIKALIEVLKSDEIKEFVDKEYKGAVVMVD